MNTNNKELDNFINEIIKLSGISSKVPLSAKILKKRVSKYIVYILTTLTNHHSNILAIKSWGGFSFDAKKALLTLGDLGSKRKYGYAWSTFQKEINFLTVLDKGNNFKKQFQIVQLIKSIYLPYALT